MIETLTSPTGRRSTDAMSDLAQSLPTVRFLELKLGPDRALACYVNAFRYGERSRLTRSALDAQIGTLLSYRHGIDDAFPYRAGDLRFLSGQEEDETFWEQLTGLKFNFLSIDARATTEGTKEESRLCMLIEPILRHGLLDDDGFILSLAASGPTPMIAAVAKPLATRFTKRKMELTVLEDIGTIRMS